MASVYCQELIRNSKVLCEGYIGEILGRKAKGTPMDDPQLSEHHQQLNKSIKSPGKESAVDGENEKDEEKGSKKSGSGEKDNLGNQLKENYYLEDDAKLLDVLIKNCHPILTDMLK